MPELRVLSYNVRSLLDDNAALVNVVRTLRPDVVLAQEAPRRFRWRARCAALARECGLLYLAGGRSAGGNLLMVAPRISSHGQKERRIPQPFGKPIRGIVSATLGLGDVRFGAVGVHLGLARAARKAEIQDVLATAAAFGDLPVLVAGDLNEDAGSPSWLSLANAGFTDPGRSKAIGKPAATGKSESSGNALDPTFPARDPRIRIDGILHRGDLRLRSYGVPDDPGLRADLDRATDHLPVLAVYST